MESQLGAFHEAHFGAATRAAFIRRMLPPLVPAGQHCGGSYDGQLSWEAMCRDCQQQVSAYWTSLGWTEGHADETHAEQTPAAGELKRKRHSEEEDQEEEEEEEQGEEMIQQEEVEHAGGIEIELTPAMVSMFRASEAARRDHQQLNSGMFIAVKLQLQREKRQERDAQNAIAAAAHQRSNAATHAANRRSMTGPHSLEIASLKFALDRSFAAGAASRKPVVWPVLPFDF